MIMNSRAYISHKSDSQADRWRGFLKPRKWLSSAWQQDRCQRALPPAAVLTVAPLFILAAATAHLLLIPASATLLVSTMAAFLVTTAAALLVPAAASLSFPATTSFPVSSLVPAIVTPKNQV